MTNSEDLSNRTWFITGAASGIGLAFASAALKDGDNVTGLSRTTDGLDGLVAEYGDRVLAVKADVADEAAVQAAVDSTVARFGRVDVVVNNAGLGVFGGVEENSDAQWRAVFDTNVFGALNVLRSTLPVLRKQGSGWVLQTSAHFGQHALAGVSSIAATKHAMEGWTDALAAEVAPLGIHVLTFAPGFTATPFKSKLTMGDNPSSDYDQTVRATLQQLGELPPEAVNTPERLVDAVLTAMAAEKPPRRLAIGSVSYGMVQGTLSERLGEVERWEQLSRSVDTPAG